MNLDEAIRHAVIEKLEKMQAEGITPDDQLSAVITALLKHLVQWTKFIAKKEARYMQQTGGLATYEAEQVVLVMLAEYGDLEGLDFGRFFTLTKDDEGVWHSPNEQHNDCNDED